jgi:hypothetical protein
MQTLRTCTETKDFETVAGVLQQVQGFWNAMSCLEITQRPGSLQSAAIGLNHGIRIIENPASKKKDMPCTYNVTPRRVRTTIVTLQAINITYSQ